VPKLDGHVWVPVDDEHTCVYNWMYAYDSATRITPDYAEMMEENYGRGPNDFIPGTFRLKRNPSNDYLIDRQAQKTRTFTGIEGVNTQDFALQEGMEPIVDRSKEHLGTSDRAIVTMRRLMLEATQAVERGERAPGADPAIHRNIRPHEAIIRADQNWREVFGNELAAKW
jgi:hypothetical protein